MTVSATDCLGRMACSICHDARGHCEVVRTSLIAAQSIVRGADPCTRLTRAFVPSRSHSTHSAALTNHSLIFAGQFISKSAPHQGTLGVLRSPDSCSKCTTAGRWRKGPLSPFPSRPPIAYPMPRAGIRVTWPIRYADKVKGIRRQGRREGMGRLIAAVDSSSTASWAAEVC